MPAKLNSYLWQSRHGIYYLRVERNGKESRKSLRTRDPAVAKSAAYAFGASLMSNEKPFSDSLSSIFSGEPDPVVESAFAELAARSIASKARIDALAKQIAGVVEAAPAMPTASLLTKEQTLEEALRDYKHEVGAGKSANTWHTYQSGFNKLLAGLGATTPIASINGEAFTLWRMEAMDGKQSPETTAKDLRGIRGLFKWAIKRGRHLGPDPVEAPDLAPVVRDQQTKQFAQERLPFSGDDLEKIVPAVLAAPKPCGFWIPLIAFMTGARPGEIAELLLDDITQGADGTISIQIRKGKTVSSARTIPLPAQLSGILDYVADVRRTNPSATQLFPHLLPQAKNGRWNSPSKDFGKLKTALGFGKGKDCYSFRHTWITMAALAGINDRAARQYVGHTIEKDGRDDSHLDYIHLDDLKKLVVDRIDFKAWPGYDVPAIRYTSGQFDSVLTAPPKQKRKLRRKPRANKP